MAKRINKRVLTCFDCPYCAHREEFYIEEDDSHETGWFCRHVDVGGPAVVLLDNGGNSIKNYADVYGKNKVPNFCPLPEDDFEPMFGE